MDELKNKKALIITAVIVVLIGGGYYWHRHSAKKTVSAKAKTTQSQVSDKSLTGKKAAKLGTAPDTTQVNTDTSAVPSTSTQTSTPSGSVTAK